MEDLQELYNIHSLFYIIIGMLVFVIANIDDIDNNTKTKHQWLQYSLFTLIAIIAGICICAVCDAPRGMYWLSAIFCGLAGGVILSKIDSRKDEIGDVTVDKIKNTITSADIVKSINNRSVNVKTPLIEQDGITHNQHIDDSNTFIDPEQSPYNPFEDENNSNN